MIKNIEFRQVSKTNYNMTSGKSTILRKHLYLYEVDKTTTRSWTTLHRPTRKRAINNEAKDIATNLNIADRAERMAERQAFITLKDHKDNFQNKPSCRLINPAKSEIGRISKKLLENISTSRQKTGLNQWKNSTP